MIFGAGVLGGAQADLLAVPAADFQVLKIPEGITTEQALLLTTPSPPVGRQPNEPIFHSAPPWRSSAWEPSALRAAQRLHTRHATVFVDSSKGTPQRDHLGATLIPSPRPRLTRRGVAAQTRVD